MNQTINFRTIFNDEEPNLNFVMIQHIPTGFYNISKINDLIFEEKLKNSSERTLRSSKKVIQDWIDDNENEDLINKLRTITKTDDVILYITKASNRHNGIYVHKYLYEQILNWIDKEYAIRFHIIFNSRIEDHSINYKTLVDDYKVLVKFNNIISDKNLTLSKNNRLLLDENINIVQKNESFNNDINKTIDEFNEILEDYKDIISLQDERIKNQDTILENIESNLKKNNANNANDNFILSNWWILIILYLSCMYILYIL